LGAVQFGIENVGSTCFTKHEILWGIGGLNIAFTSLISLCLFSLLGLIVKQFLVAFFHNNVLVSSERYILNGNQEKYQKEKREVLH